jgi:hypothetical protein
VWLLELTETPQVAGGPVLVCRASTSGCGSQPPTPRCLRGRGGGLGLHQDAGVGVST